MKDFVVFEIMGECLYFTLIVVQCGSLCCDVFVGFLRCCGKRRRVEFCDGVAKRGGTQKIGRSKDWALKITTLRYCFLWWHFVPLWLKMV